MSMNVSNLQIQYVDGTPNKLMENLADDLFFKSNSGIRNTTIEVKGSTLILNGWFEIDDVALFVRQQKNIIVRTSPMHTSDGWLRIVEGNEEWGVSIPAFLEGRDNVQS